MFMEGTDESLRYLDASYAEVKEKLSLRNPVGHCQKRPCSLRNPEPAPTSAEADENGAERADKSQRMKRAGANAS